MSRLAAILGSLLVFVSVAHGAAVKDPLVSEAMAKDAYVLGEFVSRSCPVCRDMHPIAEAAIARHQRISLQVHDADKELDLANLYKVRCVPVYVVVDPRGKVRFNDVGPRTADQFDEILRRAGVKRR